MIQQALGEIGFNSPTPIQCKTIPHLIESDRDLIALAQTGTGKTAAFGLPIIQKLKEIDEVQALILCPTRELAIQVAKELKEFMKYLPKFKVISVFGGERIDKQIREIKKSPQIVVGTPGRTNDLIKRRVLKVDKIKWLVLDEADEMLNMGFKEELDEILKSCPSKKQVLLFSATMSTSIRKIANNYMRDPEDFLVGEKNKGAQNIQHFYYMVQNKNRYAALKRIADMNPNIHGIVFCRTRKETQEVSDKLIQDKYSAEVIHGEISQEQRTKVMDRFRNKKFQILVATDVAARGIDVSDLTHIINYNLPENAGGYIHRSGRTGRANKKGISLAIISNQEHRKIKDIERKLGKKIEKGIIPSGADICGKQLESLLEKINKIEINEIQLEKYNDLIKAKFQDITREEIIKKLISIEFNRFLNHSEYMEDLNEKIIPQKVGNYSGKRFRRRRNFSRFKTKRKR